MLIGNVQVVEGGPDDVDDVLALLEETGISIQGNPDIYSREYRQFGINEAREIPERAARRALGPGSGARRIFIITTPVMTGEAQNALLKTLEESPSDALFFFIVPSPHMLLPTVRSRAQILTLSRHAKNAEVLIDPKEFLSSGAEGRLDMLKVLLEKGDDDLSKGLGAGKRDIAGIVRFLSSLEEVLSKKVTAKTNTEGIEAIYRARAYIGDKGALIKPLLEQVALLIDNV